MKKYLVTGGAGFIGSNLVDKLIEEGSSVVVIDNLSTGKKENINKKAKFYNLDISSNKVESVFKKEKIDVVFHFGAQINVRKSTENPKEDAMINIIGSINIFECAKKYNVNKIIFSSTGGVMYGDKAKIPSKESDTELPFCPYGVSKLSTEKYLNYYKEVFGIDYVILRFANVYGKRQNYLGEAGVVAIFLNNMINKKESFITGNGKQTRDFVYINDVVNACIIATKKNISGIYNIGTGKETSINTIFDKLKKLTDYREKRSYVKGKKGEQKRSCLSIEKAKKELNWKPQYSLDKGLEETARWFKNNDCL